MYFTHRVQSPDSQQPIKEPSFKYYPFLYFQLCEIAIYLWLGFIGDTKDFQFLFLVKLRGILFLEQLTVDE